MHEGSSRLHYASWPWLFVYRSSHYISWRFRWHRSYAGDFVFGRQDFLGFDECFARKIFGICTQTSNQNRNSHISKQTKWNFFFFFSATVGSEKTSWTQHSLWCCIRVILYLCFSVCVYGDVLLDWFNSGCWKFSSFSRTLWQVSKKKGWHYLVLLQ